MSLELAPNSRYGGGRLKKAWPAKYGIALATWARREILQSAPAQRGAPGGKRSLSLRSRGP